MARPAGCGQPIPSIRIDAGGRSIHSRAAAARALSARAQEARDAQNVSLVEVDVGIRDALRREIACGDDRRDVVILRDSRRGRATSSCYAASEHLLDEVDAQQVGRDGTRRRVVRFGAR